MEYQKTYWVEEITDYLDEQIIQLIEVRTGQMGDSPTEWAIAAVKIEALQKVRQHFCGETFPVDAHIKRLQENFLGDI